MRRREWAGLVILLLELGAAVGCGVDSYLTCGAPCEDGGSDATVVDTGGGNDGSPQQDVFVKDSGFDAKDSSNGEAGCLNNFCQGPGDCCGSAPFCTAGSRCATSCGAYDASCSSQPDTCCTPNFCSQGRCTCFVTDAGCSEDWQCCKGACLSGHCN